MKISQIKQILLSYLDTLRKYDSATPEVLCAPDAGAFATIEELESIELPSDLKYLLLSVGTYDDEKMDDLDLFEPHFAWGMSIIPAQCIETIYKGSAGCGGEDNPDYWPMGFLPILEDGSGSYVVVNCISSSPTYGGVYDMSEGVGCNLISLSMPEFLAASIQELEKGVRSFTAPDLSQIQNFQSYLSDSASLFGKTPYFSRPGRMDQQIVDWH